MPIGNINSFIDEAMRSNDSKNPNRQLIHKDLMVAIRELSKRWRVAKALGHLPSINNLP